MKAKIILGIIAIALTGCVSQKKYDELLAKHNRIKRENARLLPLEDRLAEMKASLRDCNDEVRRTEAVLADFYKQFDGLNGSHETLLKSYEALSRENLAMSEQFAREMADLQAALAEKEAGIGQLEEQLQRLKSENNNYSENLAALEGNLEAKEQAIDELRKQLDAQQMKMQALRHNIENALAGFNNSELEVTEKDGRIYISLSQKLLFAKGSANVDAKGVSAISQIARVLKDQKDIFIMVEGHTDIDGTPELNWDLSVERSVTVVQEMVKAGMLPERITAAGRAFYDPVVPNDTEENKSINRRTEIIISPDLKELYKVLEKEKGVSSTK